MNTQILLKRIVLFSSLKNSEIRKLADRAAVLSFRTGETVINEGDPVDAFFVVASGRLLRLTSTDDGRKEKVNLHFLPGDYFGEISILTGAHALATVKVQNDAVLLKISRDDFHRLLEKYPTLGIHLSRVLSTRLSAANTESFRSRYQKKCHIISAYSATQQAGKTIFATNLVVSIFNETHEPTLLVSLDALDDDITAKYHLNKEDIKVLNLKDFQDSTLDDYISLHHSGYNVFIVKSGGESQEVEEKIVPLITRLMKFYRYIIIDLPAIRTRPVFKMVTQSDRVYLLTKPDEDSLKKTADLIRTLKNHLTPSEEKIKVILNAVEKRRGYGDVEHKLGFGVEYALTLTPELEPERSREFVLSCPYKSYSRSILHIAREISDRLVGLALSSGAARGFAHIGVLKVLERENIIVDVVAGSSMGAFIAACWAAGINAKKMTQLSEDYKNQLRLLGLVDFFFPRLGFIRGRKVERLLQSILGERTFADVLMPLRIVSTDLYTGEEYVFNKGLLWEAVRASISIPGIFEPARIDDNVLLDGGVVDPAPVGVLTRMGVKKIIAVNVIPDRELRTADNNEKKEMTRVTGNEKRAVIKRSLRKVGRFFGKHIVPHIFDVIMRTHQYMEYELAEYACEDADVIIRPNTQELSWVDFYRVDEFIQKGIEAAEESLPELKKLSL